MSDSSERYFDSVGADWDRLREGFYSTRVRDHALAAAGVEGGRIAADLGAGTGFLTEALLDHGVRVIAVDRSPAMIEALQGKFPDPGRVDCRLGEAEALPIVDGEVDYCLASMFLHHVERPAVAIGEMARVLRPGGRIVIADLDAHDREFLREEHHDRWLGFERAQVRRWFQDAGLGEIRIDDIGETCCSTSIRGECAAIGIFVASGVRSA